jgi:uncharacterized radical SAM superfamily Fe-S cluster-containing enzyme
VRLLDGPRQGLGLCIDGIGSAAGSQHQACHRQEHSANHRGLLSLAGAKHHRPPVRWRRVRDLRISVTDRCNFRCVYCMPKSVFDEDYPFLRAPSC